MFEHYVTNYSAAEMKNEKLVGFGDLSGDGDDDLLDDADMQTGDDMDSAGGIDLGV